MKKLLLHAIISSILFFQCQGNLKSREDFLNTDISFEDVQNYYDGFIKYTQNQVDLLKTLRKAKKFSWFPGASSFLGWIIKKEADKRGYNKASQRLLTIAELILDKQWQNRINKVLRNCSDEYLAYLNQVHKQIRDIAKNRQLSGEKKLNAMLEVLHENHVNKLQERQGFNDTRKMQLIENNITEKNGQYIFYNHLVAYKEEHGDYSPLTILNLLIPYMYYEQRLIYENGVRWN